MIWHYFPIGFRFPVGDFSDETMRRCWQIALSALLCGDPKDVTLYDAQQTYDVGSGGPVYLCIACFFGIKQARATAKILYELDLLMTRLCEHMPFLQANALESFGPYPQLGKIEQDGSVSVTEAGESLLGGITASPMSRQDGIRLLIVSDETAEAGSAETCTRALAVAAAERSFCVRRMMTANGGFGTVRALVTGMNGRYETVAVNDRNGERKTETIGVLPGQIAAVESAGRDCATVGELIKKSLDLGYRRIRLGTVGCLDPENALMILESLGMQFRNAADAAVRPAADQLDRIVHADRTTLDARLASCECVAFTDSQTNDDSVIAAILETPSAGNALLCALGVLGFETASGAETVFRAIDFETAARQSDFVVLHTFGSKSETALHALSELNALKKPTGLLCEDPADAHRLMHEYPVLRGVVSLADQAEAAIEAAFDAEVLPMIGKDVAKTTRI